MAILMNTTPTCRCRPRSGWSTGSTETSANYDASCWPATTANRSQSKTDIADGHAAGADEYIIRPFSPKDLLQRVDGLLAQQAGGSFAAVGH
jgi:hypothetical protein